MFNQFARYEDAFRDWRRDGMPGPKPESYGYIEFLTSKDDDQLPREADPLVKTLVKKWMKRHGITIRWIDGQKHQRRYVPDFFVEYVDGKKKIVEVKGPSRIDSNDVQRKRKAAEIWCKKRGMEYVLATA